METGSGLDRLPGGPQVENLMDEWRRAIACGETLAEAASSSAARISTSIHDSMDECVSALLPVAQALAAASSKFAASARTTQRLRSVWLEKQLEEVDAVEKLMSACARLTSTQVAGYEFICDRFDAHADCGRGSAEASSDLSYGVVAENDFLEAAHVLDSVSGVYPLLLTSPGMPRLSSYLFSSPNNLLFDIPRCVRVQKGADAECTRSTLTGPAVDVFVLGVKEGEEGEEVQSAHANVLSFQCVDETGEPLRWIVREDVEVAVQYGTGDETEANVLLPSCTPHVELSGHVATVSMIITNQRTEWVTISISLPGASPIYLRPKAVRSLCGCLVAAHNLRHSTGNVGLAVNRAADVMVAIHATSTRAVMSVFRLPKPEEEPSRGSELLTAFPIQAPSDANVPVRPHKVCFNPLAGDTVFVVEDNLRCVEEFSLAGASLRRLGNITGGSRGIDAFGGLLAVGTFGVYSGASDSRVLLYDIVTGELLHSIGGGGGPGTRVMGASGVRFSSDGKCILVSDYGNSRVCVWDSKSGAQLASIGDGILSSPRDALFAPNGEIVVADNGNSRVCVFSAQGRLLRTFDAASTCSPSVWSCPTALATVHNRLFVMCLNSAVVVVLE